MLLHLSASFQSNCSQISARKTRFLDWIRGISSDSMESWWQRPTRRLNLNLKNWRKPINLAMFEPIKISFAFPLHLSPVDTQRACNWLWLKYELDEMFYFKEIFASLPCRFRLLSMFWNWRRDSGEGAATRPQTHVWARLVGWFYGIGALVQI